MLNDKQLCAHTENVTSFFPLSYGQQALWFLYQMAPESIAYNIFITVRIRSALDLLSLRRAWQKIFERHPILRTTYTTYQGKPVQLVHEEQEVSIQLTDGTNWSEDYLREQILAETDRPFNLEKDSVLRINVFTRSAQEHILLLTMHHIAGDLWSFDLLLEEIQVLYAAETGKVSQEQTEIGLYSLNKKKPYAEFVRWQSEMLSSYRGEELWEYWQKQLAGELPILNLFTNRSRPPVQTDRGAMHVLKLDDQLIQNLRNLARAFGTSLYKILLAAFYVQLYRYTNQEDILVGSPMAGRSSREKFQGIVGYLVNPVVLRASVSGNPTFKEFLAQVSNTVKEAQKHQDYPFSLLVERLQQERDPSRSPLFQVSFSWQKQRWCKPGKNPLHRQKQGLELEPYLLGQRGAGLDLNVMVMETQGLLQTCWQYNTDLFDASTMQRMAGHFQSLLEGIVINPHQPISQLPLLSEVERQQLLVEWNSTTLEYPTDKCIHSLFEEQAQRIPNAVAVVYENQQLTYDELNCRANQLAHYLRSLSIGADVLVGICVERSLDLMVGLLGILKAGGAYVPLDPSNPLERLNYILEDAQVQVLVTNSQLGNTLAQSNFVVYLDEEADKIAQYPRNNLVSGVQGDNLAYMIYTSGSTGKPKGVLINHHNIVRLFKATEGWYQFNETDVWTLFHSFAFDFSVWELWGGLLYGGCVVVVPYEVSRDSQAFYNLLVAEQVSVLNQTPSAFYQLIQVDEHSKTTEKLSLRFVIFGGEALSLPLLQPWFERHGDQLPQLVNMYGITETTVHVTIRRLTLADVKTTCSLIGLPIPDWQIYLLDKYQQPVPIGVVGEIYVGGGGVARGYWRRSELTQERFVPNPFSNQPQARLYKTGDLARYLPTGELEYKGRLDEQVKIRGFRIELGEIQAQLIQHPAVKDSIVIVVEEENEQRLVAYVIVDASQQQGTNSDYLLLDIRRHLQKKLPEYMVPAAFVLVEAFPLTPHGKVSRRDLPIPENFQSGLESSYVPPSTSTQEILANLWAGILSIQKVGIYDNFFELGGHSLLATQVISRLREIFQLELPLSYVFEFPTVAQLSQVISAKIQTDSGIRVPTITPVAREQNIPLSWAQQRLWFLHHLEGESCAYTTSFALCMSGKLNIKALERALQEIVRRHEVLRTHFQMVADQPVQVISPYVTLTLPVLELQDSPDPWQQVQQQATLAAQQPFDLVNGPIIRARLWQVTPQEYMLLLVIHHIAFDGWSLGVLSHELSTQYKAFVRGNSLPLSELSVQYADFAIWQRQYFTSTVLEHQLSYWKQQLAGAPVVLALPTDRSRPLIQTFRGSTERFEIHHYLTQQLKQLGQRSGATLFMTLLAAFVVLLCRYSGQTDIVVGSPIANRNHQQLESLIGFFVNSLALRFNLSTELTFEALLAQVRQVTLDAYSHQDLPFEMLVEELHPERKLDSNPLVQVMFALQNAPSTPWDLPGLSVEQMPLSISAVRFDIEVHFWEVPNGLIGAINYSSDLFEQATIARMIEHFQTLLAAIVAHPQQLQDKLPLLTATQQQQLLVKWNASGTDDPQSQCIHQLFETQVDKTPDAVALEFEGQQLTYRELNEQANKIAHYLRSIGVGTETLVGLCVERSPLLIVALLSILKAGGAYLPLDPNYPPERLCYILQDASVKILLTQQQFLRQLPTTDASIICLDVDSWQSADLNQVNLVSSSPDNLVYVIYTSGSTGQPKGVMVTHRAVVRLVSNTNYVNLQPSDVIAQVANISFDAATFEIWGALLNGAKLVMINKETVLSPREFANSLQTEGITTLFLTTALFNQMAQSEPLAFQSLRFLLFGGEAVDPRRVRQVLESGAPQQLLHVYGPTENTTFSTWYHIELVEQGAETIPIGCPIANTQTYILDRHLQPVPIGVPGELYVGGAGLFRGYLNRPDLSAERLISHPFSYEPGQSLYKTGDLVRYLNDGNIEFLGRLDNQIKIRGFRIESGEIEAVLNLHPLVQESVVVAREDTPGDKRLVAYLVPVVQGEELPEEVYQWQSEYVNDWQKLYEQTYNQRQTSDDLKFNTIGWNSSYTGQPIPATEMLEWVNSTVARIQAQSPKRVLEIGCGTGLLLSRIANDCEQYWGTDYSEFALQYVERLKQAVPGLQHVKLLQRMADDFEGIPFAGFDTVVLNSVVQYFPSIDYLLNVLAGAVAALGDRGTIFVGDVRSLPLLDAHHASVALSRENEKLSQKQWQQQVHQNIAREEELVIDPALFVALQERFPQIQSVEIQPKRGRFDNELCQFRYDVTLHVGTSVSTSTSVIPWLDWQLDNLTLEQVHQKLVQQPEILGIRRVINQRVQRSLQTREFWQHPPLIETVGQLRQMLSQLPLDGIDPEECWQLGQQFDYSVDLSWWEGNLNGCYDVIFYRCTKTDTSLKTMSFWNNSKVTLKPWTHYANNPLRGKLIQKLVPQIRQFLEQKLPEYMQPQLFVLLDNLPLTANGKIDRRSLPAPDIISKNLSSRFVSPRTPTEAKLAQIWTEVLNVEKIGVNDNFFELGGHSLLATQVVSRVNSVFEIDLSLIRMFESPTVAGIATYIDAVHWVGQTPVAVANSEEVEF